MTGHDTIAVLVLAAAFMLLASLPPVDRPIGWPTPKRIADRVMLWAVAVLIAIVLATIQG